VAGLLQELGSGGFAVYLDCTHHAHTISPHALEEVIGPDLQSEDPDNDGLMTWDECPDGPPSPDRDGDGLPDYLEPDDQDTDGDGVPDPQDDGDSLPTSAECPKAFWHCPESVPGAGPDYLRRLRVVDDGDPGYTAASFLKASWGFAGDSDLEARPALHPRPLQGPPHRGRALPSALSEARPRRVPGARFPPETLLDGAGGP